MKILLDSEPAPNTSNSAYEGLFHMVRTGDGTSKAVTRSIELIIEDLYRYALL